MITTTTDATRAAGLIGRALSPLPLAEWLVPDEAERTDVLSRVFTILLEHAVHLGQVDVTPGGRAVAVWFHNGTTPPPAPPDYDRRLLRAAGPHADRFHTLDRALTAHHPFDYPHHHLAFLAVEPGHQGSGLGSALMRHHHEHLNRSALGAFLNAGSPRTRELFARHGYRSHGSPYSPPDGPPVWPMWRPPAPGRF